MLDYNVYVNFEDTEHPLSKDKILRVLFGLHGKTVITILQNILKDETILNDLYDLKYNKREDIVRWAHFYERNGFSDYGRFFK